MITRYLLAARRVIRDTGENDITIVGLLEDMQMQGFPVVLPRVAVAWCVTKEPDEPGEVQGTIRTLIDAEVVNENPFTVNFQDQLTNRIILNLAGVVIPRAGTVRLSLTLNLPGNPLTADFAFGAALTPGAPPNPNIGGTFIAA